MHILFIDNELATLIGGDFNLVRFQHDKSNGVINHKWGDNFNSWLEIWSLLEIRLSRRKFTWANNQTDLIMSIIDKVFNNIDLDGLSPLATCIALPRMRSDHTPIVWELGLDSPAKSSSYKFENWWLLREDFKDLVAKIWNEPFKSQSSIEIWQEKLRKSRRVTKGWNSNIEANLRRLKRILM